MFWIGQLLAGGGVLILLVNAIRLYRHRQALSAYRDQVHRDQIRRDQLGTEFIPTALPILPIPPAFLGSTSGAGLLALVVGSAVSFGAPGATRPSREEIEHLMDEFNKLNARCSNEIKTLDDRRIVALTQISAAKIALDAYSAELRKAEVVRAEAEALAQRTLDATKDRIRQDRFSDEQAAIDAWNSVNPEAARSAAKQEADDAYVERLRQIERMMPAPPGTIESERRKARDAHEEALRKADDAFANARTAAHSTYEQRLAAAFKKAVQADQAAENQSAQQRAAAEAAQTQAKQKAGEVLTVTLNGIPSAAEIERAHARSVQESGDRCQQERESIYRRLRGED